MKAFTQNRPETNLADSRFPSSREDLRTGFLGIFHKNYQGDARKTLLRIALGNILPVKSLSLSRSARSLIKEERNSERLQKSSLKSWEARRAEADLGSFLRLKKINSGSPHFEVSIPLLSANTPMTLAHAWGHFSQTGVDDEEDRAIRALFQSPVLWSGASCIERAHLSSATGALFNACLDSVTTDVHAQGLVVYLNFRVDSETCERLCGVEWMEIRPIDLYPLFHSWISAEYRPGDHGKTAFSLSRIAASLPPHLPEDVRIDQYGVGIGSSGDPIWIPRTCDNTERYESILGEAGARDDAFQIRKIGSPEPVLPPSMPVLVDWVNQKFVYSSTMGKPVLLGLEHVRRCTPSMALNLLGREVAPDYMKTLTGLAAQSGTDTLLRAYGEDQNIEVDKYLKIQTAAIAKEVPSFQLRYLDLTLDSDWPQLLPVARFIIALADKILENLPVMYERFAVSTVMNHLGMLSVIARYGATLGATRDQARTDNRSALDQGIDKDWVPPPIPLITSRFQSENGGFLPHQLKCRNLLRDRPNNAVLSVRAGGGKSMLAITDILYEIDSGAKGPFLIMCPSHLVANYVSEIVEFTDGQLNVIPVTSYNIRNTGYRRYNDILRDAPVNTIIVVDYDVLKFRARSVVYGNSAVDVYPVIEMLRRYTPEYVFLDESHVLRNSLSARARSVMSLIADIKKKRIASGTLNPDSPSDLPGQIAILDPTVFGSRTRFNERYGAELSGERVLRWRTEGVNSIHDIQPQLKNSIVYVAAERREWACAMPPREDRVVSVGLTPNQRIVYDALFNDMIQQIRADAEKSAAARRLLASLDGESVDEDEADEDDVGAGLQPYLADIERFITNPTGHPYSQNGIVLEDGTRIPALSGDDLVSGKARVLREELTKYLGENDGKAIVFVNYSASAEYLYEAMGPELQAMGLLYRASEKTETINRFRTQASVRWMIGIRKSMEIGLNLQAASFLARVESCWTPGEQEQGDSRISRPFFGAAGDQRTRLQFVSIVADKTMDITKVARLRAKILAVAKFENAGSPRYDEIPNIPVLKMSLDSIQNNNDFNTNLAQYQHSIAALNTAIADENEEYRQKTIDEGGFHWTPVARGKDPEGAAILARVPYAQGTELYRAADLGLVRVDNWLNVEQSAESESENGTETEVDTDVTREQRARLMGTLCHSEFGDGIVVKCSAAGGSSSINRITLQMEDGTKIPGLRTTNVFRVTRTETNSLDMRSILAEQTGLPRTEDSVSPGSNERSPAPAIEQVIELPNAPDLHTAISVSLKLSIVNGYMRLAYSGTDRRAMNALASHGFKVESPYVMTRIRNARHLLAQANRWAEEGFNIHAETNNEAFVVLNRELASNGLQSHRHYVRTVGGAQFPNYMRKIWRPVADKQLLQIFSLVTDGGAQDPIAIRQAAKNGSNPAYGIAFLCLPWGSGHPASRLAVNSKYRVAGTRWTVSDRTSSVFVGSLAGIHVVLGRLKEAGIRVDNIPELNRDARSVRKIVPKTDTIDPQFNSVN